ncbi:MAG: transcription-repair coupling factor [Desulfobacterales bacterium]|nr:transcription-repair coupling factor [Desulfobacterales bacterium]
MSDHQNQHVDTLKRWLREGSESMAVVGLSGSAQSYFFARVLADLDRPCLIVLPERKGAVRLYRELQFFMGAESEEGSPHLRLHQFLPYDMSPLTGLSPHRELVTRRINALYALMSDRNPVVITSLEAACFRVMPKESLINSLEYLESGEEVDRDLLLKRLEINGYQRTSLVEESGDYSVRGGVIDIFSPLYLFPLRLEFWGDRLESIRQFDPVSQRSRNHSEEMILLPAVEIIMDEAGVQRARSMGRLPRQPEDSMGFPGQEAWLNHFYPHLDTLIQYLPEDGMVALLDPHRMESESLKIQNRFQKEEERFREESAEKGVPFPDIEGVFVPFQELARQSKGHQKIEFGELHLSGKGGPEKTLEIRGRFELEEDLEIRLANKGRVSMAPFAQKVAAWLAARSRVVITCSTEQQASRLREILENYDVQVDKVARGWGEIPETPGLNICLGRLPKGFTWPDMGLYVVSEDEVFGPKKALRRQKRSEHTGGLSWSSFSQLKAGDLVVHEDHGIGRYGGLSTMEITQKMNDFVIVEYANNSKLYIPADRVSILQKYAGAGETEPKLDQLGGYSWNIAKQKAKNSVKKIARQLVEIYALRKYRKGYAFSPPDHYFRQFEATFEHEETDDQIKAVEDVLSDLASEQPMDRLICGDVGFGKTEIAVRAAFKTVSDGKQVAFLVPTTVLVEQHFETFKQRLTPYSIEVGVLSRFKTRAQQAEVIGKLRSGKIDILIGTHRIFQKDVRFADLGLLIIDEEQRFGVRQKEALKKYRALVDVLAITATPIPRTLQMSMMGVRDLSVIETPPRDRLAIETYLSPYDESLIIRAIESELERGGQTFFVHNRVHTIDHASDELRKLVPQARFAVAHGQMKSRDLEKTMMRFLKKEIDVLVCTTIIESGLDIPSANTIIIDQADRLGLAQIYQLRGRVGRSKEKAYAYLIISNGSTLTRDAEKRLKALMDFSHLGAGLHLAMHDLSIRGGGNILGFSQSGHISAVGYELYVKLIERAVTELKGEEWQDDINPEINIDIPAYLPGSYVMDTDVRLNLYRRLSNLLEKSELEEMIEEISDRFGSPPREVVNLFGLMSVRLFLKRLRISKLDLGRNNLILTFPEEKGIDIEHLIRLTNAQPNRFRFLPRNRLRITTGALSFPDDFPEIEKAMEILDFKTEQSDGRHSELGRTGQKAKKYA